MSARSDATSTLRGHCSRLQQEKGSLEIKLIRQEEGAKEAAERAAQKAAAERKEAIADAVAQANAQREKEHRQYVAEIEKLKREKEEAEEIHRLRSSDAASRYWKVKREKEQEVDALQQQVASEQQQRHRAEADCNNARAAAGQAQSIAQTEHNLRLTAEQQLEQQFKIAQDNKVSILKAEGRAKGAESGIAETFRQLEAMEKQYRQVKKEHDTLVEAHGAAQKNYDEVAKKMEKLQKFHEDVERDRAIRAASQPQPDDSGDPCPKCGIKSKQLRICHMCTIGMCDRCTVYKPGSGMNAACIECYDKKVKKTEMEMQEALIAAQKLARDQGAALAEVRTKLTKQQEECSKQYAEKGFTIEMARLPQPGNGYWDSVHPNGLRHEHPMPKGMARITPLGSSY